MIRVIVDNKSQRNTPFYNPVIFRRLKVRPTREVEWIEGTKLLRLQLIVVATVGITHLISAAFVWDDPGHDSRSKITQIMVHQRNRCIPSGKLVFVVSFDIP